MPNSKPNWPIEQVAEPLRAAGLALLLTSRQTLPLAVAPVEASLTLPLLSPEEALDLFAQSYGRTDVEHLAPEDRTAAMRIVTYLGRHTLAVKLAGGYLAKQRRPLGAYADALEADPRRALILRDGQEAVNLVLATSYDALPERAQRAFVALALFATTDIGRRAAIAAAAAAAGDADPEPGDPFAAEEAVEELVARRLVDPATIETMPAESDREQIRVHPLVRTFAETRCAAWPTAERDATSLAIAEWYADYANRTADLALTPDEANILGALEWAHTHGEDELVAELCRGMQYFWRDTGRTAASLRYLPWGVAAAEAVAGMSDDREARLRAARLALTYGVALMNVGRLDDAQRTFEMNLTLRREAGDRGGEGAALTFLGQVAQRRGRLEEAEGYYQQALAIRREVQDRQGEGVDLYSLATIAEARGNLDRAEALHRESLAIGIEVQDGPGVADSLLELGRFLVERRGQREEGCQMLAEAVRRYREMGLSERAEDAQATFEALCGSA